LVVLCHGFPETPVFVTPPAARAGRSRISPVAPDIAGILGEKIGAVSLFDFASATWDQIKESKWLWEPFLYDQRPLKEATTVAFPVQNLVRIHLEVVEVLERMIPEYSQ
jgi:hypothetical protein